MFGRVHRKKGQQLADSLRFPDSGCDRVPVLQVQSVANGKAEIRIPGKRSRLLDELVDRAGCTKQLMQEAGTATALRGCYLLIQSRLFIGPTDASVNHAFPPSFGN